jgi:hypothetical protein
LPRSLWLQAQLAHLRQFGFLRSEVSACVPPVAVLSEAEDASPDLHLVLQFVKGATGIHSPVGARLCLNRLLARAYVLVPAVMDICTVCAVCAVRTVRTSFVRVRPRAPLWCVMGHTFFCIPCAPLGFGGALVCLCHRVCGCEVVPF